MIGTQCAHAAREVGDGLPFWRRSDSLRSSTASRSLEIGKLMLVAPLPPDLFLKRQRSFKAQQYNTLMRCIFLVTDRSLIDMQQETKRIMIRHSVLSLQKAYFDLPLRGRGMVLGERGNFFSR